MSTSMREALDAAFKKQEEIGGSEEDTEEPVRDTGEEEESESPTEVEEKEKEGGKEESEEVQEDAEEGDEGHPEEESGKGKDDPKSAKTEPDKSGSKDGAPTDAAADLKAPVSWKPGIREHWGKLPKEVKEEIHRREKEIEKGLHQASGFRKVANEYFNVVKPFEQLIRAQNSTPAQAITNLMQTAARLTMGTKAQKAAVVQEIIKNYDVDIEALDTLLAGKTVPAEEDKISRLLEERLKPVNEFISSVNGHRKAAEQKSDEEVSKELDAFAQDPKNEFFQDVVDDMADIMDMAAKRGQTVTLPQAYDRACRLNPEIAKILEQRANAEKGRLDAERLQKKRTAASSIKGARGEGDDAKPPATDVRSAIASAWADAEEDR